MNPPTFSIQLDLPVQERYKELVSFYDIPSISHEIESLYDSFYLPHDISKLLPPQTINKLMYTDEISFWSKTFNIPFYKILLLQLVYELHSGCTTVILNKTMYRTMDWPLVFLKSITYHAIVFNNGRQIYEGICWLGTVGLFTGKNDSFSIAINYRRTKPISIQTFLDNIQRAIKGYYPVSYLVRHVLETNSLDLLERSSVISPVYYIVNPFDGKQPYILIREYESFVKKEDTYVIQTNTDTPTSQPNIMFSHERHSILEHAISNNENIIKTMKTYPILNEDTIYFSILSNTKINIYL
jgi:hypothetical protein